VCGRRTNSPIIAFHINVPVKLDEHFEFLAYRVGQSMARWDITKVNIPRRVGKKVVSCHNHYAALRQTPGCNMLHHDARNFQNLVLRFFLRDNASFAHYTHMRCLKRTTSCLFCCHTSPATPLDVSLHWKYEERSGIWDASKQCWKSSFLLLDLIYKDSRAMIAHTPQDSKNCWKESNMNHWLC